jgi:hypothetical protein
MSAIFPSLAQAVIWKGIAEDIQPMLIGQGIALVDTYGIERNADGDVRPKLVAKCLEFALEDHKLRLAEQDHDLLVTSKSFPPSFELDWSQRYHFSSPSA